MPHPVFISYARKTCREPAEELHRELGGESGLAFLDTSDIEAGEQFPRILVDALLDAKVIVVFADESAEAGDRCSNGRDENAAVRHALNVRSHAQKATNSLLRHSR
jgi:hypothetical protein